MLPCARRLELWVALTSALLAGGCGRLHFEDVAHAERDAALPFDAATPDATLGEPEDAGLNLEDAEPTPQDAAEPDAEPPDACPPAGCAARGLILYWKLDESAELSAHDESSSMLHGSYVGETGLPSTSPLVPSLQFVDPASHAFLAGSRQAVRLENMPEVLRPALDFTLSIWYRATITDTAGGELISGGNDYVLRVKSELIEFAKRVDDGTGGGTFAGCYGFSSLVLDGVWHHLAGVNSSSGMVAYRDGTIICTNADTRAPLYGKGGSDLWLGRHGNLDGRFDFEGNMDDARIYNRALSADEVSQLAAGFEY